ncbi:MAG: Na+/H+ antiporter NhaA [Dokdonella sp.]|nr:Na+/H+ antiporter NhaA [Dokdonella sp.]MCB1572389.1 Na+/H+ antiporter NhaA [Xanthomonadales bacterium]MCB1577119.1 Na+/H+ antiporter NhaA [Xanthomonadales bacterium]
MLSSVRNAIDEFLARETSAGFMLFAAALLALAAVNSPLAPHYDGLLQTAVELRVGAFEIAKPLQLWINDGLMAVFFFLVGLEVKREIVQGELSSMEKAGLPIVAAIGGMAVPALVFVAVNRDVAANLAGWAIPAATDIAFALGVLALLGKRIPAALKILLLAIAIIDDIGAIAIIAVFYTADVSVFALGLAAIAIAVLVALNRFGVTRIAAYVLVGVFLWACVLKSGVHATLAGVVTALAVPLTGAQGKSPLEQLEHGLHPWVAFAVLPLFAFANAGVSFDGLRADDLLGPLPLGIALGLLVGKQVGVFGFMLLAIRFGMVRKPGGVSWGQLWGLACLTGIGFTMSLFIGSLAFDSAAAMEQVKIGVLAGSLAGGLLGFLILRTSKPASDPSASPR